MRRAVNEPLPGAPEPWVPSEMPAFRGRPPYVMTEMIAAEPALAERLVARLTNDPVIDDLVGAIRQAMATRAPIRTTGCGTSEHAAIGIAELLNDALSPAAGHEIQPVQALQVIRRPPTEGLLVAVSHEGGTPATNAAIRAARAAGATTAIITTGGGSPGAAEAAHTVQTGEQDQSWCHTVGYLSPLVVGVVLAARVAGMRIDAAALRAHLDAADDPHAAADAAAGLAKVDRIMVVGTGPDEPATRELALKLAEGARLPATAHDLETVLHGHLAAANRWAGLVLVLTDAARTGPMVAERSARLLDAARILGLATAAILGPATSEAIATEDTAAGRLVLPRAGRVHQLTAAVLGSAIALQLLTERLARARHVNPDTLGREDPAQAAANA